jgi:hypothetical protein
MFGARRCFLPALVAFALLAGVAGCGGAEAGDAQPLPASREVATTDAPAADAGPAIEVRNFSSGEVVRYPVPLLKGVLADKGVAEIVVTNTSSERDTRAMKGLARGGRFRALTELVPGENKLVLKAGGKTAKLSLVYKPQTNPRVVRAVYVTGSEGETDFQTPLADDPQDWRGKLGTALLIMQTFTADRMSELGYGRRTFNLEFDGQGRVKVHRVKLGETSQSLLKRDGNWLFGRIYAAIDRQLPNPLAKNLAVMAFTRFDPETRRALAHTALGGGNLGLFGGGGIFTWPDGIRDVQAGFTDERMIDPARFFSDSIGRHAYWANSSTCIGAALHEIGHALALPHSSDPRDIMTRGHDFLNRAFTLVEPPHAGRGKVFEFARDEEAAWKPISAAAIAAHRFLALDDREFVDGARTSLEVDVDTSELVVSSDLGLAFVAVEVPGRADFFRGARPGGEAPKEMRFCAAELGKRLGTEQLAVRVVDAEGNHSRLRVAEALVPYVRTWRFSKMTVPWEDEQAFVDVNVEEGGVARAAELAGGVERTTSPSPYVDFLPRFPKDKRERMAAYVVRRVYTEKARKVRILTGSDDALRLWVNGERLLDILALRGAKPDSEWTDATLRAGDNTVVAEVSQGTGGWGLFLRIADTEGNPLHLTEADALVPWDASGVRRLLRGPFVNAWRFAPEVRPWKNKQRFVKMDAGEIARIAASAARADLVSSPGAIVDFAKRFPAGKRADVAGYALRRIVSRAPRRVKLLTGSDDALRVWLNGKLITEKLALRGAVADSESSTAELRRGENEILVEVSQGMGDWALCLRITDESGRSLALGDDGRLAPLDEPAADSDEGADEDSGM